MGSVQSVGGAATSGQGFTGQQITAAILGSVYEQHAGRQRLTFEAETTEKNKYTAGSDSTLVLERKETKAELPSAGGKRAFSTTWEDQQVSIHEYAPEVFRELRQLDGVSNEDFMDEWNIYNQLNDVNNMLGKGQSADGSSAHPKKGDKRTVEPVQGDAPASTTAEAADAGLELGEGRSMAMFLKSKTMTYMLKTISDQEVKVLVELLPAYRAYMIGGDNAKGGVSSEDYSRHSSDNEQDSKKKAQAPAHNTTPKGGNPDSLLMRFVMLLKVVTRKVQVKFDEVEYEAGKFEVTSDSETTELVGDEVGYILVFSDIFRSCDLLHERWDIKGRHPKPGKFRHFPKMDEKLQRIKEHEEGKKSAIASNERNEAEHDKLITRKDKDLTRMFWITDDPEDQSTLPHFAALGKGAANNIRSKLVEQLTRDFHFLRDNGLMDYSILVGVRYNLPEGNDASSPTPSPAAIASPSSTDLSSTTNKVQSTSLRMKFALGEEGQEGVSEARPSRAGSPRNIDVMPSLTDDSPASPSAPESHGINIAHHTSVFHEGVNGIDGHETYYIGIIDMLTEYTWKKRSANFFKSFLWRDVTLSTIPPQDYCARIEKFASRIFPIVITVDDEADQSASTSAPVPTNSAPQNKNRKPQE